jgi:hypothetical protein
MRPPCCSSAADRDKESWPPNQQMLAESNSDPGVSFLDFAAGGHNYRNYRRYLPDALQWLDHPTTWLTDVIFAWILGLVMERRREFAILATMGTGNRDMLVVPPSRCERCRGKSRRRHPHRTSVRTVSPTRARWLLRPTAATALGASHRPHGFGCSGTAHNRASPSVRSTCWSTAS